MHFSLSLPTTSLLLLLPLLQHLSLAAPSPAPEPIPAPALEVRNTSPLTIPYFSSGAALEISTGETKVYYQSADGAIHQRSGFNSPGAKNVYTDTIILAAGKARKGTPLAVTNLITTGFVIRLYYISLTFQLKEIINDGDGRGWRTGDLDSYNIFVKPKSQYLYAISIPLKFNPRVGYQNPKGYLAEAAFDFATLKWKTYLF